MSDYPGDCPSDSATITPLPTQAFVVLAVPSITLQSLTLTRQSGTSGGGVELSGGPLIITDFNWSVNGSISTPVTINGIATISGDSQNGESLIAANFNLAGTTTVSGTGLSFGSAAKVTNTGRFYLQPGATIFADCCQNPTQLVNQGTVIISPPLPGSTTATINGPAFTDQGNVTISKGATLDLQTAPSTFSPAVPLTSVPFAGGGILLINNLANIQLTGTVDLSGGTTVQVGTSQASDEGFLTGTGTLTGNGTFSWVQGTVGANLTVASPVKTTISGNTLKVLNAAYGPNTGLLTIAGATTLSGTGLFLTGHGTTGTSILTNTGTFTPKPGSTISAQACCVTAAQFVNKGKLNVNVGAGQTFAIPQPGQPGVAFINSSTVNLKSGTFLFGQPGYTQTAGDTNLQGGDLTSPPPSPAAMDLQGGKLTGKGTITANMVNEAVIDPGSSPTSEGIITIKGSYTQTSAGKLQADIKGSATAGTGYDQLAVTGHASLGGTLAYNLAGSPPYTLQGTDFFPLITYSAHTGQFAALDPSVTKPRYWVNYKPTSAVFSYGPWGIDSAGACLGSPPVCSPEISAANYSSVQQALGTPDFWGRYIGDPAAGFPDLTCTQKAHVYQKDITSAEVGEAKQLQLPILPIYFNYNPAAVQMAQCGQDYAKAAIASAQHWGIPSGTAIFVDIEYNVQTTPEFIKAWYDEFKNSPYKAGYYANTSKPTTNFESAYCQAVVNLEPGIGQNSLIWTSSPGQNWTNKAEEPRYQAVSPPCSSQTAAWQYNGGQTNPPPVEVDTNEALPTLPLWKPWQ